MNNDLTTVLTGVPQETITTTSNSASGNYPIGISMGTLSAANYTFTFVNGNVTIATTTQTINFSALSNVTYGVAPITLTATASSGLPVSYSVTVPATVAASILTIRGVGAMA